MLELMVTDQDLARFAAWTNLAETTFLYPPEDAQDYKVRIMMPSREMLFAGIPHLGAACLSRTQVACQKNPVSSARVWNRHR